MYFFKIIILVVLLNFTLADVGIEEFKKQQIVPDVIDSVPQFILKVTFDGDLKVNLGNELTPTQVKNKPTIIWDASQDKFYTLIVVDPDAPSREKPTNREAQHYIVGNIPGNKLSEGNVLTEYIGAAPGPNGGLHRYVYLVYEQPKKLSFDEKIIKKDLNPKRAGFSTRKFVEKYGLGIPIAGNFYQAAWDHYVPKLYIELTKNTATEGVKNFF